MAGVGRGGEMGDVRVGDGVGGEAAGKVDRWREVGGKGKGLAGGVGCRSLGIGCPSGAPHPTKACGTSPATESLGAPCTFGAGELKVAAWNLDGATAAKMLAFSDTCADCDHMPDVIVLTETHRIVACNALLGYTTCPDL